MAYKSLTDLIAATITRLRQVPGAGTQLYSESEIATHLREGYMLCSEQRKWPWIFGWYNRTLDGTLGIPTQGFSEIASIQDIKSIWYGTQQRPLPYLPQQINPYTVTGTVPRFVEILNGEDGAVYNPPRYFRVWPLTATGNIYVYAKRTPSQLFTNPSVVVPFDDLTLTAYAAYKYAEVTGSSSANSFKTSFADLLTVQTDWYDRQPSLLDPRMQFGPDEWVEYPWI